MSENNEINASCLCGKTGLAIAELQSNVGACHCATCRKWGGGPFMTLDCGTNVVLKGEAFIGTFNSSDWAERGFCTQCGTHLFFRMKENKQYFVPAGLLQDIAGFVFDHQVFIDAKLDYYCFANKTQEMTREALFAQFSAD